MTVQGKYHRKLKSSLLLIGFIFVLLLFLFYTSAMNRTLQYRYQKSLCDIVGYHTSRAEAGLTTIELIKATLMDMESIDIWAKTRKNGQLAYYTDAIPLMNDLNRIAYAFALMKMDFSVTTLDPDSFVVTPSGTVDKHTYFLDTYQIGEEDYQKILDDFSGETAERIIPGYNSQGYLETFHYFFKKPYSANELIYYIHIPLSSLLSEYVGQKFVIFSDEGFIAYSSADRATQEEMRRQFERIDVANLQMGEVHEDREAYFLHAVSNTGKWHALFFYDALTIEMRTIVLSCALALVLLIVVFIITERVVRWLYHPVASTVKEVVQEGEDSIPPEASSIDEFSLFKQKAIAARELTSNLAVLSDENSKLRTQKMLRECILGIRSSRVDESLAILSDFREACVALVEFSEQEESLGEVADDPVYLGKNALLNYVGQHDTMYVVNISSQRAALIIRVQDSGAVHEILKCVMSELNAVSDFYITLSRIRQGMDALHESYMEACRLMEYKYLHPNAIVLTVDQLSTQSLSGYYFPIVLEHRIIECLAKGKEQALDLFDDLIHENSDLRERSSESHQSFIYALLGMISRTFQELKIIREESLQKKIDELYSNWNNPNAISSIRTIMQEIIALVQASNNSSNDTTLEAMKQYIYANYAQDISLNDMAYALGISAKYCGNLFKRLSNDSFKNFLNSYRIQQAKRILEENPNIKVVDLSRQVGFNSSSSFIRVFGKYTGVTPGAYASQYMNRQD